MAEDAQPEFPCVVANKAAGYTIVPFRADFGVVETMPWPYVYGVSSITNKKIQSQANGPFSSAISLSN
jgi:hypothetical protein